MIWPLFRFWGRNLPNISLIFWKILKNQKPLVESKKLRYLFQIFLAFLAYLNFTSSNLQHLQMSRFLSQIFRNFPWILSWHHWSLTIWHLASTKKLHRQSVICTRPKLPMRQSKLLRKTDRAALHSDTNAHQHCTVWFLSQIWLPHITNFHCHWKRRILM